MKKVLTMMLAAMMLLIPLAETALAADFETTTIPEVDVTEEVLMPEKLAPEPYEGPCTTCLEHFEEVKAWTPIPDEVWGPEIPIFDVDDVEPMPDYGCDQPGPIVTVYYEEDGSERVADDAFLAENPVLAKALEECGGCIENIYISRDRYEAYFAECGGGMGFHICNWDMDVTNPDDFRLVRVPTQARWTGVMGDNIFLAIYAGESLRYQFDFEGDHYLYWGFADKVEECLEYVDLRLDRSGFLPQLIEKTPRVADPEVKYPPVVTPIP